MRATSLGPLTAAALALTASLLPARAAAAPAPGGGTPSELTLSFIPVDPRVASRGDGEAFVDLGSLAAERPGARGKASGGNVAVRQRVGIRVDSPAGSVSVVRLQAYLASETPGCVVRIDGVALTAIPRTLDPVHRVGTTVVHEVEIVVPPQVPAGPYASAITWVAESL